MLNRCFTIHNLPEVRITILNYNSCARLLHNSLDVKPYAIEEAAGLMGDRVAFIHLSKAKSCHRGKVLSFDFFKLK
ncbi:MAG: hypothetical protein AB4050_11755 [Synechococcus sp.]